LTSRCRLADRIALELLAHGPLACEPLARIVGARTADVLDALRHDPRFAHTGHGRGSRWKLDVTPWEGLGRNLSAEARSDDGYRLRALERRVAALERRLLEVGWPAE
jgi:hypothetical protein